MSDSESSNLSDEYEMLPSNWLKSYRLEEEMRKKNKGDPKSLREELERLGLTP